MILSFSILIRIFQCIRNYGQQNNSRRSYFVRRDLDDCPVKFGYLEMWLDPGFSFSKLTVGEKGSVKRCFFLCVAAWWTSECSLTFAQCHLRLQLILQPWIEQSSRSWILIGIHYLIWMNYYWMCEWIDKLMLNRSTNTQQITAGHPSCYLCRCNKLYLTSVFSKYASDFSS